ncbi:hypothetical protein OG866_12355 [Streptomyces sp. NBC_00663]|uniref:hypothetical protein n=1 Tax=Streptomyces sp. NBC_00663 TaxID=2975801 RepID=UPI002E32875D|nr:hypothetical protein [Streptomyces sp. NBC_00663]
MTAANRRGRFTTIAITAAAVALTAGLVTGCEDSDARDCLGNADRITESLKAIHDGEFIDTVEKNLGTIDDGTDDGKVDQAVKDLKKAVEDYNEAVLNGDTDPDSSRIDAAAKALTDVCAP